MPIDHRAAESNGSGIRPGGRRAWHPAWNAFVLTLLVVTFFLLAHPNRGIWHDAILYNAQALYNAHPEYFRYDLFFEFGSQDQWTLYGKIFGKLITWVGIAKGNTVGMAVSLTLWWSGMWRLSRYLLPNPWRWVCLVFIAGMEASYGGGFIFSYGEFFLTGRLPAEALSLWALTFVLEGRKLAAFAAASLAMTIHPLIGAVGWIIVLLLATPRLAWWRCSGVALALFAALQFLTPASFAIHPFDAAWRKIIHTELSYVLPSEWDVISWSRACWLIALPLTLSAIAETAEQRRFWSLVALLGTAGLSFSWVADVAGHDIVWMQLQLWRVFWLLTILQWIAAATLVLTTWQSRPALLWLLAICWLIFEGGGGGFLALVLAGVTLIERWHKDRGRPHIPEYFTTITPTLKLCLIVMTLAALGDWYHLQHANDSTRMMYWDGTSRVHFAWLDTLRRTQFMAMVAAVMCTAYISEDRRARALFYVLLIALFSYATVNFDQRSPTMKVMESRLDKPQLAPFVGRVSPGQMVYWDGPLLDIVYPWLLMHTASYFSASQTSGIIFHRETTFEAMRRDTELGFTKRHGDLPADDELSRRGTRFVPLSRDGILDICHEPHLDFVVSPTRYADIASGATWAPDKKHTYWLYNCQTINGMGLPKKNNK